MSSEKRSEDWIWIIKPDGEKRIGSPSFIRSLLGLENVRGEINDLKRRLLKAERPLRKRKILELLGSGDSEGKPHSSRWFLTRLNWWFSSVSEYEVNGDIRELAEEGKVSTFKSGGHLMVKLCEKGSP